MPWTVYALRCPESNEVKYIGWTDKRPSVRLAAHITEARNRMGNPSQAITRKHRWICSILSKGAEPALEIIEQGEGRMGPEAEKRWIAFYLGNGAALVNTTRGGEGPPVSMIQRTTAQRREAALRGLAAMSAERRQRHIANTVTARNAKTTPEQRREISRKARAKITPERRRDGGRRGGTKAWANRSPEQRSAMARAASQRLSPEQRREYMQKLQASLTPERRKAIQAAKSPEALSNAAKKRWAGLSPERRAQIIQKLNGGRTREQRSEATRKWRAEAKRKRAA
jgi:hypothetical protein